jgi:hypothetical protein
VGVAWSWLAALALAVVGTAVIGLRGYLVPYTPQFAPRLVSFLPVDPFHGGEQIARPTRADGNGDPLASTATGSLSGQQAGASAGEQLMRDLLEADVLVAEGEQLYLGDDVHDRWQSAMAKLRPVSSEDLARMANTVTAADTVEPFDHDEDWFMLRSDSGSVEDDVALSRPVLIAELAAMDALETVLDDQSQRRQAAQHLRMFLQECPDCEVELVESTTMDCCGGNPDPQSEPDEVLACPECNHRLYTFPS